MEKDLPYKRLARVPMAAAMAVLLIAALLAGCSLQAETPQPSALPGAALPGVASPGTANVRQSAVNFFLNTVVRIEAYDATSSELNEILSHCAEYEALLSKTIDGSDVSRINSANGAPVRVSDHTRNVLAKALYISELSGGAFDVTIAPASELWDFSEDNAAPSLPDEAALAGAAQRIDYTKIQLEGNTVTLPAGMMIDLGGIAKGYVADEIAELCGQRGIRSGMLDFGGNIVVFGDKPDGSPWGVGVQDPDSRRGAYMAVLAVAEGSIVTSGAYERGFDLDGVRYHHILDPKTGWPVQNELISVTIQSQSSMEGDGLSTACFALGLEEGMALVRGLPGVEAVFITKDRQIMATEGAALVE